MTKKSKIIALIATVAVALSVVLLMAFGDQFKHAVLAKGNDSIATVRELSLIHI